MTSESPTIPENEKPTNAPKHWIVCAAVLNTETGELVCAPRHHHCMEALMRRYGDALDWDGYVQGFVDQRGEFFSRIRAYDIAKANGQIRFPGSDTGVLFSEDLY